MRERLTYFSHLANQHHYNRLQAKEDWEVAGLLEKAQQQAQNIKQTATLNKERNNQS